jgi:demethylmenaquinone methyltransferase/2-methoxy-6-polyprenyl-1,4-benzoquinol methylase
MKSIALRQDSQKMREMFTTIAPRYDFVTRAFSLGFDRRWKQFAVKKASLLDGSLVLDLASGTGDFSQLVHQLVPTAKTVAVDLTEQMLHLARVRGVADLICADAAALPFAEGLFACVFIGYGLRNFPDLALALKEIARVTRPGGLMVSLDFFLPAGRIRRVLYLGSMYAVCGFWGLVLHGRPSIYTYIPDSLRSFISIENFSSLLRTMGYARVDSRAHNSGVIGLHWAAKE